MNLPADPRQQQLQFYASAAYPCSYLPGRQAQSLIAVPHQLIDATLYSGLIRQGFRRSGKFTYRPCCEHCNACVPVRLPVQLFQPDRSQRRAFRQHRHLTAQVLEPQFSDEHYALYHAYQRARHPSGGMDMDDAGQYRNFLLQSHVDTVLVEFREDGQLRMLSVVDCVQDGLSAVYTFYDCSDTRTAYGTYNVLWLANWCRSLDLPHLYLGYWIAESRKMAYKSNFSPLQALVNGRWEALKK
jgi:leucyl-tRNA---protein transferase